MGLLLLAQEGGDEIYDIAVTFDAAADSSFSALLYRLPNAKWFGLARIFFPEPLNVAGRIVNHPSRVYEARVDDFGDISKSIPIPSGMPEAVRARLRLIDTDNSYRDRFGTETPQGKTVEIRFMQEGTSEEAADIHFSGIIETFEKGDGYLEVEAVGNLLAWVDEVFPDLMTPANFPEFPDVKQAFLPVVIGHNVGKAVSIGFSSGAPALPADGAIVAASDAASALTAEILAATFVPVGHPQITPQEWIDKVESKYGQGLALIFSEYNLQSAAGILTLEDAEYAQAALIALLDATDDRATEFAAIDSLHAGVIANFRGGVTAFFGADWANLLAAVQADIDRLGPEPPEELFAPQGVIELPHIGFAEGIGDRWGAAQHPLWEVLCIYRMIPGEDAFTPVETSEYSVVVEAREFGERPDESFDCTFIDFTEQQPEGTRIRMDADGAYDRPAFGDLPAVGYAHDGSIGPLRNPVDGLLILKAHLWPKSGDADAWDVDSLASLREKFRIGGSTIPPLFMDGATVESMTARERIARWNASFQTHLLDSNRGRYKVVRVDDSDSARPVLTEHEILQASFKERSPLQTINRYLANYMADYANDGQWFELALADNIADQEARGKIQDQTVLLWDVRDTQTALAAVRDRLRYTALRSMIQRLTAPLPEVSHFLELCRQIGITHRQGSQITGYHNREVQITKARLNIKRFEAEIESIVRVPLAFGELVEMEADFDAGADSEVSGLDVLVARPTAYTLDPAPGPAIRGTITDPTFAFDGNPSTRTRYETSGGVGTSTYAAWHGHTMSIDPPGGAISAVLKARAQHGFGGNGSGPTITIALFDGIDTNPVHAGIPINFPAGEFGPGDYSSDPIAIATYNAMTSPTVRLLEWTGSQEFSLPYPFLDAFEVWIEFTST